jgi:hypothetical protein
VDFGADPRQKAAAPKAHLFTEDTHVAQEDDRLKKMASIARRDKLDHPETYARARQRGANAPQAPEGVRAAVGLGGGLQLAMVFDDGGRLSMCPDGNGGCHLFWKWHAGRFKGHYVYWRVWEPTGLIVGLHMLSDRYEEVLAGYRQPIKDTPRPE